jgi:hypothetical protein
MAMSWVAEQKVARAASAAREPSAILGSIVPMAPIEAISPSCMISIQPRRRPSQGSR